MPRKTKKTKSIGTPNIEVAAPDGWDEVPADVVADIAAEDPKEDAETEAAIGELIESVKEELEISSPVIEPAASPEPVTDTDAPTVRPFSFDDGCQPNLATVLRDVATIKVGTAGWHFQHAKDGRFGSGATGRYTHRIVRIESIGDAMADGSRPVTGYRFVGLCYNADGTLDSNGCWASAPSSRDPSHDPMIKVIGGETIEGLDATRGGTGSMAKQCADTRGASIKLYPNTGSEHLPCVVIGAAPAFKNGGMYSLTAIVDADGNPVT